MSLNEISLVIQNGRSSNMKRAAEVAIFDDKKPFCEMKSLEDSCGVRFTRWFSVLKEGMAYEIPK